MLVASMGLPAYPSINRVQPSQPESFWRQHGTTNLLSCLHEWRTRGSKNAGSFTRLNLGNGVCSAISSL
jgi:hypothetical protein